MELAEEVAVEGQGKEVTVTTPLQMHGTRYWRTYVEIELRTRLMAIYQITT